MDKPPIQDFNDQTKDMLLCSMTVLNVGFFPQVHAPLLNCNCLWWSLQVLLCAVVYRPPKYNKGFIHEFSEFLADILPKYEKLLICGDFKDHVCCPSDQFATDFKSLLATFILIQSMDKATHHLGHILDVVISFGLSFSLKDIS